MLRAVTAHLGRRPCGAAEPLRPLGIMKFATKPSASRPKSDRSVYVGNLPHTWTEEDVKKAFQQVGPIDKVHMAKDHETNQFRGFAFVEFVDPSDAANAVEFGAKLGKKKYLVKPFVPPPPKSSPRRNTSSRSSSTSLPSRAVGDASPIVYFGNLPFGGSDDDVVDLFSKCGPIKHIHLVKNSADQSRGYGSVEFEDTVSVAAALALAGRTDVTRTEHNRPLIVKLPHQTKLNVPSTVVLLKGVSPNTTEEAVEAAIRATGAKIAHVHLQKDNETKEPRGKGYVILHDADSVEKAITVTHINGNKIEITISHDFKNKPKTLFVGNLPDNVTEEDIRDVFATCGPIYQVRLAQHPGSSRVFAHVQYASSASLIAARRIESPTIGGRKLYLQVAMDE
ncbi:hypothetical protein H310_13933 [Aphanomyces invadans]|uniref:RRM domain-containing protein n=1 Tax=Aphanomyces invadans TaxID=157072 RepID=A0A024TBL2_9STRA|nr:hypothetical protein H310_13933 [Aphanomyces invadans]ETV91550.1 hypothetical protein H310_13933 [Aphanomyces invadans]|eukprot:XP_008879818.1 hypothetical protein H310_13933 [Aphanomyces invadans]